jgi:thioesterase domain-containing protein/acyl carrier protein
MSGDWIPVTLPAQIRTLMPNTEIISLGGATEASIWSILFPIKEVDPSWKSIPYGRAMAAQSFRVLDTCLEECPTWVTGALYIGGVGLAKGYWRDHQKTAASFITHPHTGERLYRTGDLGRWLPDGNIEFLGREDFQVKIQGFRIELEEIEAALLQHSGLKAAVVTACGKKFGEKQLVAHIVPRNGPVDFQQLRQFLREKIPCYMVPSTFLPLSNLPLGANGKVNRAALSEQAAALAPRPICTPPSPEAASGTLRLITEIVESILKITPIDPDANLLDLGVSSLNMVAISTVIESEVHARPKMADFYRTPTIRALSHVCDQTKERSRPIVPVQLAGSKTPFFFLHHDYSGSDGFHCIRLSRLIGDDRPFYMIHPHGTVGGEPLPTIPEIAASRLEDLRAVRPHGPYILGGFCTGAMIAFEMARKLEAAGEKVECLLLVGGEASNLRFQWLRRCVDGVASFLRMDPQTGVELFLKSREAIIKMAEWRNARIRTVVHYGRFPREVVPRMRSHLRSLIRWFKSSTEERKKRELPESAFTLRARRLFGLYLRAFGQYFPGPCRARVIIIWPEEMAPVDLRNPAVHWRRICPDFEVRRVPGGHDSWISQVEYVRVVAGVMKEAMDNAGDCNADKP